MLENAINVIYLPFDLQDQSISIDLKNLEKYITWRLAQKHLKVFNKIFKL